VFTFKGILRSAFRKPVWERFEEQLQGDGRVLADKIQSRSIILWYTRQILPRCRFVILVRDPRDAVISALKTGFFESRFHADREREVEVKRYCIDWSRNAQIALGKRGHPYQVMVRYEDLVTDPKSQIERINSLYPFDLEFRLQAREEMSSSASLSSEDHHQKLSESINSGSIGRHKEYNNQRLIRRIESVCEREMDALGYT
jgi:hypothetical protein